MNSLSVSRLNDLKTIYDAIHWAWDTCDEGDWETMTQQMLFNTCMKYIGKKVNPSTLQTAIEQLEKFQLPRNVQEQEHTIGQI